VNVRMADVVVINKEDTANFEDIEEVRENVGTSIHKPSLSMQLPHFC